MPRSGLAEVSRIVEGVEFTVDVSRKQIPVLVTREYLESNCGAEKDRETWLLAFAKNQTVIVEAARERYNQHPDLRVIILKE